MGVLFGADIAFVVSVYHNFADIFASIGENGIIALVSVAIIFAVLKK